MQTNYKTSKEAYESLKADFEERIGDNIQTGSVIDIYTKAVADECGDMYGYIEANKNPYLFTNTYGSDLDSLGYWVNLAREDGEDDSTYKHRLKDWMASAEASNTTAISDSLLNTKFSSSIDYVPYTHGAGTGTCYVIPREYEEETIVNALKEAKELISGTVSPAQYIEYIVPRMKSVALICYIVTGGDEESIKNVIASEIKNYINSIAPGKFLELGSIIKIGLDQDGVEYFNVTTLLIDDSVCSDVKVVQEKDTKFIYDNIEWVS